MSRKIKIFTVSAIALVAVGLISVFAVRHVYTQALLPVSDDDTAVLVTIPSGATSKEIAADLEDKGLIKKSWAFEAYIRNSNVRDQLKAGSYSLAPSMGVKQIVSIITDGAVATDLVTILPAKRLSEIQQRLTDEGFSTEAVSNALSPDTHANHPALVDKPSTASLEGYVYPETFQVTADSDPTYVVSAALDQLDAILTAEVRAKIAKQGLSIHEAIILASIIENEVPSDEDRKKAAQVFLSRLRQGIALESNATDEYPANYDTYNIQGLPPGPLTNFTASALLAIAEPSDTDYMFFVTGKDGVTRFSSTIQEHEALIAEHGVSGVE